MPTAPESQDATLLQRRARRRLVGAIALVVLVVIVFPVLLDKDPRPISQDLVVQIPSPDSAKFKSPPAPAGMAAETPAPPPATPSVAPAAVPAAADAKAPAAAPPAATPISAGAPEAAPAKTAEAADDAKKAQAALEGKEEWIVRIEAFADPKNARQLQSKLAAAGVKHYSDTVKSARGELTRVRAGPFASRAEAESAAKKIEGIGIKPGKVIQR